MYAGSGMYYCPVIVWPSALAIARATASGLSPFHREAGACQLDGRGNGGSSTDASHIAAEFINRFKRERPGLPAIALNTDMAVITSIANDYDFSEIFAKQLKALADEGDVVIAISTSGNSPNIMKAMDVAKKRKLTTIAFTGLKGEKFASRATFAFVVPSDNTPRIQETHITIGHVICQIVEDILFDIPRKK